MPTGTAFCTVTVRHPAAAADVPPTSATKGTTVAIARPTASRAVVVTRPSCPTPPSWPWSMADEVDDLLERRPVLPVDGARADDAGGDRGDVVEVLVVGQLVDRRDLLRRQRSLHRCVQGRAQCGATRRERPAVGLRKRAGDMSPEHPAQRLGDVAVPGDAVPGRAETLPRVVVD